MRLRRLLLRRRAAITPSYDTKILLCFDILPLMATPRAIR